MGDFRYDHWQINSLLLPMGIMVIKQNHITTYWGVLSHEPIIIFVTFFFFARIEEHKQEA